MVTMAVIIFRNRSLSTILTSLLTFLLLSAIPCDSFSSSGSNGNASSSSSQPPPFLFVDRFRASCPANLDAIRQFDPSLLIDNDHKNNKDDEDDVWVAVYRSANNLPSVFVRDAFFDAMRASTTTTATPTTTTTSTSSISVSASDFVTENDSSSSSLSSTSSSGVMVSSSAAAANAKPVAVARLGKCCSSSSSSSQKQQRRYMIDSMRCTLKKENIDPDCDGGSEHAEAVGICIDELVLSYLRRYYSEMERESKIRNNTRGDTDIPITTMSFDGGIRFRGTLVSGKLLDSRGFREATELSTDMHSHESDLDGAMHMYAQRSTSLQLGGSARERATQIVSYLGRLDREKDIRRGRGGGIVALTTSGEETDNNNEDDAEQGGFDPWASVKKFI